MSKEEKPVSLLAMTGICIAFILIPAFLFGLYWLWAPSFSASPRVHAPEKVCFNNRRLIEAATDQYAIEYDLEIGDPVTWSDISPYFKGETAPICPKGGVYSFPEIDAFPSCTRHGVATP